MLRKCLQKIYKLVKQWKTVLKSWLNFFAERTIVLKIVYIFFSDAAYSIYRKKLFVTVELYMRQFIPNIYIYTKHRDRVVTTLSPTLLEYDTLLPELTSLG